MYNGLELILETIGARFIPPTGLIPVHEIALDVTEQTLEFNTLLGTVVVLVVDPDTAPQIVVVKPLSTSVLGPLSVLTPLVPSSDVRRM
jgi:hypothetical protein